ncbi:MAG TPA: heavy metal translocating P-type ATPase [Polyangiaceae bacterium]
MNGPGEPGADVGALAEWIGRHDGVLSVVHDSPSGTIVVRYDEKRAAGRFFRGALLDRARATRSVQKAEPRRLEVSIAHELPGRVRLRVTDAPPEAIDRLAAFIDRLDGVARARASPGSESILVLFDPGVISARGLLDRIEEAPPTTWPAAPPAAPTPYLEWLKTGFSTAVLAGAVTGVVPAPVMLGAVALTAIPPFRRAIRSLAGGRVNVDVMDAVAISVCVARAEPITASVITALLAVGDLVLDRTHARARTAISRLMQLDDGEAFVLGAADAPPRRVHPRELAPGMRIVVYPGARVPADGVLVEGSLAVDEKALTGESVPRERLTGDRVMAASVAVHGQAVVEVERAGGDTVAARIVQILEGAGSKPMTLQRNAERVADRLVLPTFGAAGAAWALSGMVDRLTSVLITDFGTGVRVAVPTSALAAMTLAAREGVLVKGATFLERLHEADTVVFDKTGTLTLGVPEVTRVVRLSRWSEREIASLAAAAEGNQSHPIADAIRRHADRLGAPARVADNGSEAYQIGLGLQAMVDGRRVQVGNARMMREHGIDPAASQAARDELGRAGESCVLLAVDGVLAAVIGYADAPRPESADVVARLKAGGRRRVLLLSGDAQAPVEAIARVVGIDEAVAEVLPANKADVVRRLRAEGRKVAMVGDGINDAPALAEADVGISLHGGTDVALETADVVLLEGGLARLPAVFGVADDAMARVKQVLGIVLVPNALAIAAGALGFINPVLAAVVNNGSTIAAAGHALAPLLRRRPR